MLAVWDVVMKTVCSGVSVGSCGFVLYCDGHVVGAPVKSMGAHVVRVGRRWERTRPPEWGRRFVTWPVAAMVGGRSGERLGVGVAGWEMVAARLGVGFAN